LVEYYIVRSADQYFKTREAGVFSGIMPPLSPEGGVEDAVDFVFHHRNIQQQQQQQQISHN